MSFSVETSTGLSFALAWWFSGVFHEICHIAIAIAVGLAREALSRENLLGIFQRRVHIKTSGWRRSAVLRAGWIGRFAVLSSDCQTFVSK